jgi:hypothetical protein
MRNTGADMSSVFARGGVCMITVAHGVCWEPRHVKSTCLADHPCTAQVLTHAAQTEGTYVLALPAMTQQMSRRASVGVM